MDIFDSQWLLNMLAKSSKTPQGRMLSLFDILNDWIAAPEIQIKIPSNSIDSSRLIDFLTLQAKYLGASNPSILAEHIVLIARNAAQQEINQPGSCSLFHAKKAANALILAQTQREFVWLENIKTKHIAYSIAASLFIMIGIATIWLSAFSHKNTPHVLASTAKVDIKKVNVPVVNLRYTALTAQEAATMYAKYEQMRNGTCQFPEAIQIPDKDKVVYLENVVGGKIPTNLKDLETANAYLEKVRCNFTPMLMENSR
jgi:hypothetical protein